MKSSISAISRRLTEPGLGGGRAHGTGTRCDHVVDDHLDGDAVAGGVRPEPHAMAEHVPRQRPARPPGTPRRAGACSSAHTLTSRPQQIVARGEAPRSTHFSTSSDGERCRQSVSALKGRVAPTRRRMYFASDSCRNTSRVIARAQLDDALLRHQRLQAHLLEVEVDQLLLLRRRQVRDVDDDGEAIGRRLPRAGTCPARVPPGSSSRSRS